MFLFSTGLLTTHSSIYHHVFLSVCEHQVLINKMFRIIHRAATEQPQSSHRTVTDQFDSNYMKLHMHAKEKQEIEYGQSKLVAKRIYAYKESGKCEMEAFFHCIRK